MTDFELYLLVGGAARFIVWGIAVVVCFRIRSRIGIVAFSFSMLMAAVNTAIGIGAVERDGFVAHFAATANTPTAALVVLTLILNHRNRP